MRHALNYSSFVLIAKNYSQIFFNATIHHLASFTLREGFNPKAFMEKRTQQK